MLQQCTLNCQYLKTYSRLLRLGIEQHVIDFKNLGHSKLSVV